MVSTRWLDELPCGARRKKENAAIGSSASKSGLSQSENAFRCCRCVVADESDVQKHVSMDGLIRQIGILPEWTAKSTSLLGRWRQIDEKGSWQGLLKASGVPALVIPLLISTPGTEPDIEYEHGKEGALKRRFRERKTGKVLVYGREWEPLGLGKGTESVLMKTWATRISWDRGALRIYKTSGGIQVEEVIFIARGKLVDVTIGRSCSGAEAWHAQA
mmetsp:Transcript_58268/g.129904  ORF Transcript_58268/g.129904 Transcript_58268/m.129904 type:complete len:217 (-) Transcript_58268:327-977(-)